MANPHSTPFFPLGGGLDLITPAVAAKPGRCIAALNYEPVASGYRRMRGFERYDGKIAPSTRTFYRINFTGGKNTPVAGNLFTRGPGPYYENGVIAAVVVESGSFAALNATGYLVVAISQSQPSATPNGTLRKAPATDIGTAVGTPTLLSEADSAPYFSTFPALARQHIAAVPGSGPVRGLVYLDGRLYAFRDNVGATEGKLYYTSYGWSGVLLGYSATFDQGGQDGLEIVEGAQYDNVAGGGSGASIANVYHASVTSGSWTDGDAAGTLTADQGMAPPFWANGNYLYPYLGADNAKRVVRLTSAPTAITLPPGGTYRAIIHNFYGASDRERAYFVSGVGPAFSLGSYGAYSAAIPINTGMVNDKPNRIAAYRNSLFLAFPGGSVQFSAVGEPFSFDPVIGAGEIGVGSEVTGLANIPNSLAILAERSINVLYGHDASDYQLEVLTNEAGALPFTAQRIGQLIYMDNRGLRSLSASQSWGNFSMGTLSRFIAPLLEDYRRDGVDPVASLISRTADQYWVFFSNGTGLIAYMGRKDPEIMPFNLGKVVTATASVEMEGEERIFIGCDDGFVYELNKGTSFDGAEIEAYVRLPFNHFGGPQQKKRVHKVLVDVEASGPTTLNVSADFDNGRVQGTNPQALVVSTGGGGIDDLGSNELYYASQIETVAEAYLDGVFTNISLKIGSDTAAEECHTLTGVTFHITGRGQRR